MMDVLKYLSKENHVKWIFWNKYEEVDTIRPFEERCIDEFTTTTMVSLIRKHKADLILHQGPGHLIVTQAGEITKKKVLTLWCYWEEFIHLDTNVNILERKKYTKCHDFEYILDHAAFPMVCSRFMAEACQEIYGRHVEILYTLPDESSFSNVSFDLSIKKYVLLADIQGLKGGDLIKKILHCIHNIPFLLIYKGGEDRLYDDMQAFLSNRPATSSEVLLFRRQNDMPLVYSKSRIQLIASSCDETFCRTIVESFYTGTFFISSNMGNLKYMNDANLGVTLSTLSPDVWVKEINEAYFDEPRLERFNSRSRSFFSFNSVKKKLRTIMDGVKEPIMIYTPWCDQGLGIQSRSYKLHLESHGFKVHIFANKPMIQNVNLMASPIEWSQDDVFHSVHTREEYSKIEIVDFVRNTRVKKALIPEIEKASTFAVTDLLNKLGVKVYAIPNIEIVRKNELKDFTKFHKIICHNKLCQGILSGYLHNVPMAHVTYTHHFPFEVEKRVKCIKDDIKFLHVAGLNGHFRKNTRQIIEVFDKFSGMCKNCSLTVSIQGHEYLKIDNNNPRIRIIAAELTYKEICQLYIDHDISIQISKHEGLGLGFYESLYLATPVLTLDTPPHNEIVIHNKYGWCMQCSKSGNNEVKNGLVSEAIVSNGTLAYWLRKIVVDRSMYYKIFDEVYEYKNNNNTIVEALK